ncbi:hypothetical protein [Natronobacterium gregoryi]|uniref:Uncharacterized protein n=2 Tax=Natronobacterium gregoryi TaxID=44930 RepID=L0AL44_NATGS|nr:hypothetical protein [Natronobacterium gregoryi]AFZ74598.1 hypothetical protein Natgr_3479 [Natronobacterium gregoryi SP2]ELY72578.1 hypothetical protein C490_03278 [Natronobacterium gregoryi SP2]PLK19788.1 hypothetical protein CYV19_12835 [Natronobacterium gregoryi SP2]SFJ30207.1 hypothetical protein SAMN05443661_12116 [Natronobacterium gregoryi]
MIDGTLAFLDEPADEPLENYHDTHRALHVESAVSYLDDELTVQRGTVAGRVPKEEEIVSMNGHEIEVDRETRTRTVPSDWIADVSGGGWVVAERTHTPREQDEYLDIDWPFTEFVKRTGIDIDHVGFSPAQFVRNQRDADRDYTIEMASREYNGDDVSIEWGQGALKKDAIKSDVGVALTTLWNGEFVRLVVYGSGYFAIWEPEEMQIEEFARFVDEEIVPIAHVLEDETEGGEDESEQDTLERAEVGA